ncbi:MAG TPA: ChaN family lipoprotein [Fimbriimonadaceae bacterium]|nr:ChaN family lipoprotein [Fimbriimonadaceae bacterium]
MLAALVAVSALTHQTAPDAVHLPIGRGGSMQIAPGEFANLREGKPATFDQFIVATEHSRFVYLGEQHATAAHQELEAKVIRAIQTSGRHVIVGVEMYQRPKQDVLDLWSEGKLEEPEFLIQSDWKGQWGFDYKFYKPVLDAVKEFRLPLVALNVPRDWVRAVGKGGYAGLPMSAKLQLPAELFLGNVEHRKVFEAMMGGHQMTGTSMENMYAAQVLWDEGMADTALKYLARVPATQSSVFVIIAGAGHVMYDEGINYRITRRRGGAGTTLVMLESKAPVEVSRGLGTFACVTATPPDRKPR